MVLLASKYDESRYFRAEDLKSEVKLRIKNGTEEKMADGEVKLTVWFTNDKRGLVLNRTNNRALRGAYGDPVEGWSGKIIVLFPTTAEIGGKSVPAMRVRIPPPKEANKATASPPKQTPKPVEEELDDGFDDPDQLDDDVSKVP
jgi:hypothetical protein